MDPWTKISIEIDNFQSACTIILKKCIPVGAELFHGDFLYFSAINRAIEVGEGFRDAAKNQNLSVMPILIRAQINTLATLYYLESSEYSQEIIQKFNEGVEFRHIRIPGQNAKLIEKVLIEKANEKYEWVQTVYSRSSSWVHLSPTSTYSPIDINEAGEVSFRVPRLPEEKYQPFVDELCQCMAACLNGILKHLETWASVSRNIELAP